MDRLLVTHYHRYTNMYYSFDSGMLGTSQLPEIVNTLLSGGTLLITIIITRDRDRDSIYTVVERATKSSAASPNFSTHTSRCGNLHHMLVCPNFLSLPCCWNSHFTARRRNWNLKLHSLAPVSLLNIPTPGSRAQSRKHRATAHWQGSQGGHAGREGC